MPAVNAVEHVSTRIRDGIAVTMASGYVANAKTRNRRKKMMQAQVTANDIKAQAYVRIKNAPERFHGLYVVARRDWNADLWYYGSYDTEDRAREVSKELGNGVILEVLL